MFANWIEPSDHGATINAEARVQPIGVQGRGGVAAVRPLVRAFGSLVGSDGIELAVRRAEQPMSCESFVTNRVLPPAPCLMSLA